MIFMHRQKPLETKREDRPDPIAPVTHDHPGKSIERLVLHEQVVLAYRLGPPSVIVSLLPIVFFWWIIHPIYPGLRSNGWFAGSLVFAAVRIIIAYLYKRREATPDTAGFWGLLFSLCLFVEGLLWGYAGIALFPFGHPYLQVLLIITIAGTAAGVLPFVMPLRWTYASYAIPMMVPLGAYMIYLGSIEQILIGVLTVCFTGFMLFSSVGIRRNVVENISSRFRQTLMAEELETANRQLRDEIAERKRAEEALRKSGALFRAVVEKSSEGLLLTNVEGEILYASPPVMEGFGYSPADLIGREARGLVHDEDSHTLAEAMLWVRQNPGKPNNIVVRIRHKDESWRWVDITARNLLSEPGVGAVVSNLRDITDRMKARDALEESENKFRNLVEKAIVGVYLVQDHVFKYANSKCAEIHGYDDPGEMHGLEIREFIFSEDLSIVKKTKEWVYGEVQDHGSQQFRIVRKDGQVRQVEIYGRGTTYRGKPAVIGMIIDVTDRKEAEEALRWKTTFLEALVASSQDGILVLDSRMQRVTQNQRLVEMWKMPRDVAEAEDEERLINFITASIKNPEELYKKLMHLHNHPVDSIRGEFELKEGAAIEAFSYPVLGKNSAEQYGRIWMFRDITELRRYWDMLENLSTTDGLTGISNRRRFDEFLEREWRRSMREYSELSLLLIDIDCFKEFNDRYGHLQGDDCLRQIAAALSRTVRRAGDLVARYGGEEFACVLLGTGEERAVKVARKIAEEIAGLAIPDESSAVAGHVTVSIGVATTVPEKGREYSELIGRADQCLYAAKHQGRNRVVALHRDYSNEVRADDKRYGPAPRRTA
jgi:diguanylate cyclase (GGDEF)-like protein/PAS domain S-box-containing protein